MELNSDVQRHISESLMADRWETRQIAHPSHISAAKPPSRIGSAANTPGRIGAAAKPIDLGVVVALMRLTPYLFQPQLQDRRELGGRRRPGCGSPTQVGNAMVRA